MKLASISYIHTVVILSVLVLWQVLSTSDLSKKGEFELLKNAPEYHMGIVVPDPSIDYEFENAEIDSSIEYELRIIDPKYIKKHGRLVEQFLRNSLTRLDNTSTVKVNRTIHNMNKHKIHWLGVNFTKVIV